MGDEVKGKVVKVHIKDDGVISYDIRTDNGTLYLEMSEFSLVKSSTGTSYINRKP